MKISSQDQQSIHEILEKIYALNDIGGFTATSVPALARLVDADISAFNEVNYPARRMVTVIDDPAAQRWYQGHQLEFERLLHQNPLIRHFAERQDTPRKISDHISLKEWKQTDVYNTVYRHFSGNYQMAMALPLDTRRSSRSRSTASAATSPNATARC